MVFDTNALDAVFAEADRGLCIVDANDVILRANRAWSELTGAPEDVLGRALWDVLPDASGELKRLCADARRSATPCVATEQLRGGPDGGTWSQMRFRSIPGHENGDAVLVTITDVTDSHRRVLDGLLEGCHVIGRDWRYLYVNDAMTRNARRTRGELIGRTIMEVSPGIEKSELFRTFERCFAEQAHARFESEFRFVDGSSAWFEFSVQPRGDALVVLTVDITARKRSDEALVAARDELEAVVDASPVAIIALDAERNVILWSAAAQRIFGYAKDEVLGKPPPIVPADKAEELATLSGRALAGEHVRNLVTTRQARDGRRIPVSLSTGALRGAGGASRGIVAALVDLTDEVALRDALDASERRFAAAFDASPLAKLVVRVRDRRVVEANRAYLDLSSAVRDAVVGADVTELAVTPFSRENGHRWDEMGTRASVRDLAFSFPRAPGESGRAIASLEPIRIRDEDYELVIVRDVTEQERAKRDLDESDARFRQLAETIEEVFWLTDVEKGNVIYISPGYDAIWGRSGSALRANARDWIDAIHPDDRERVVQAALTKQAIGQYDEEYRVVRPDGSVRWIRDRAFPVKDASGRAFRIAGTARDVTARRELEGQLLQTQKMESIGQLAGGIAHDFNNLLTVIASSCDALGELLGTDGGPAVALVREVAQASERASGLTRQLLSFSRREVVAPRIVELGALVRDTEKMLRRILGEDVLLGLSLDAAPAHVRVDPGSWTQVLMNLAVNARDAMPRGGSLTIATRKVVLDEALTRAHPTMKPGAYALLSVGDTGTGMTPEVQARLFEPFFTTKDVGHGSGLGLSVVHGIVAQSGGFVTVTSTLGVGTTFHIHLPLTEAPPPLPEVRDVPRESRPGKETILVVEDEESIRRIVVRSLEKAGYVVLSATDGEGALALATQHAGEIHLLVTDVVMPRMDGRALADALLARRANLRVLYTSGYTDDAVVRYGIRHAEVAFLSKPYGPAALLRKVREVLDGAH